MRVFDGHFDSMHEDFGDWQGSVWRRANAAAVDAKVLCDVSKIEGRDVDVVGMAFHDDHLLPSCGMDCLSIEVRKQLKTTVCTRAAFRNRIVSD